MFLPGYSNKLKRFAGLEFNGPFKKPFLQSNWQIFVIWQRLLKDIIVDHLLFRKCPFEFFSPIDGIKQSRSEEYN